MEPTTAQLLSEARSAYHTLQTGGLPVEVRDSSGESVRYAPANASRLAAYISTLEQKLRDEVAGSAPRRAPLRPVFNI